MLAGAASNQPLAQGGVFVLDGQGAVSSALLDVNSNGNLTSGQTPLSGNYGVTDSATGRTTLSLGSSQYVFYPQAAGGVNVLGLDSASTVSGQALAQSGSLATSAISGNYAAGLGGTALIGNSGQEQVVGLLSPNGGGAITGTLDISPPGAAPFTATVNTASYTLPASNGRGSASIQASGGFTGNYNIYVVSPATVLLLEFDSNRVLTGRMDKQD